MTARTLVATLALALALPLSLAAQTPAAQSPAAPPPISPETSASLDRLAGYVMLHNPSYEYDRQLADDIGPRLTASENYVKATDWAVAEFTRLGLKNVHKESWTIAASWEPAEFASGHILAPHQQRLHLESEGWSPSTPEQGVRGDIYYLANAGTDEVVKAQADKIKGKIVLIDEASFASAKDTPFGVLIDRLNLIASLGAIAQINGMGATQNVPSMLGSGYSGVLWPLPVANLGLEDTLLIRRLLEKGPVTVKFRFINAIHKQVKVDNVVADIPGRELPAETVIIGGHLDSWNHGTGAQDNGTGAASVLGIAQAVQALNHPPRRTLRFILFGGEEEGLLGSHAYAKAHEADMASTDAVLITDTGSEAPLGWYPWGRDDEAAALAPVQPLLKNLGSDGISPSGEFAFETDHADFMARGVPTLVLWTSIEKYFQLHHKPSDTFDKVNPRDLALGSATVAVTAYAIAEQLAPFAPHLTRGQVEEQMMKIKQFDEYKDLRDRGQIY